VIVEGNKNPAFVVQLAGAVTLSNLTAKASNATATLHAALIDRVAALTLDDVTAENESSSGENGIEVLEHGSLAMTGGGAVMENGASGFAIEGSEAALALNGVRILNGSQSQAEAGGVNSEKSTLVMTNTKVAIESGLGTVHFGIAASHDTSVSLQGDTVRQNTEAIGVVLEATPATVDGLSVEMLNPTAITEGLDVETEPPAVTSTLAHVEVSGIWKGVALSATGEDVTLSDSHLATNAASARPALSYDGTLPSQGLVVERSVLQAGPKAKPGTLDATTGNVTIDSSEILGGTDGIFYENFTGGVQTLTIAGSTIGPSPGVSFETPGVVGVEAAANDLTANTVAVNIEGSILFEPQVATIVHAVNTASVTCSYSAVPSQIQTANLLAGKGEIACASGVNGNTNSSTELASLFSEIGNNFTLSPASSAIDSVPASAISLPFGLTPSATDLAGNPRVVDGNGDCVAVQDKGALELQGHSAPCSTTGGSTASATSTTTSKSSLLAPLGVIIALKLSPSSFLPAPSGATIAKAKRKPKKKFGTTISYIDSQAATTTFTVVSEAKGRKQGKTCKKSSKANKRSKPCKLLVKVGGFTHTDVAGANSLHFSGRLNGKALAKGLYTLQAVPRNAAGSGATVSKSFTIK
jgi:hypothetical protein